MNAAQTLALERHTARLDHVFHGLLSDVLAHAIVDSATGEYHFRMMAELFCLIREVIRIDADAVTTDQARLKVKEIPLGACRFEHF